MCRHSSTGSKVGRVGVYFADQLGRMPTANLHRPVSHSGVHCANTFANQFSKCTAAGRQHRHQFLWPFPTIPNPFRCGQWMFFTVFRCVHCPALSAYSNVELVFETQKPDTQAHTDTDDDSIKERPCSDCYLNKLHV